ncbi:MAG: hypothetical protein HZA81_00840 [Candidatus Taylorbacteria bacterium]|nr:hypothetical protein [Candidatus Taylorbacteria bacterium]
MSSVAYIQRWKIPSESLQKEFCKDWWQLSEANRERYGLLEASLYHIEPDHFVAIAKWQDEAREVQASKEALALAHAERWKAYRSEGPEAMTSVIEIRQ